MVRILAVGLMVLVSLSGLAQQCEGSLGENIFAQGSFGSGTENNVLNDPNIAPGYIYTSTQVPNDGFYTITNNTGAWEDLFQLWLPIGDNSPDPNGYMMVVNATNDPGIFYEEVVSGLCENTLYEFTADVINIVVREAPNHELPQIDFLLDNQVRFSTGSVPQNETWTTYGFTFQTPPGTEEMTLSLRNNAPGGIGNDLALDNISFRPCGPRAFVEYDATETIFLCENDNRDITFTADLGNSGYKIVWQLSRDGGITWEDLLSSQNAGIIHREFLPGTYRYRYLAAPSLANLENVKCRTISDELEIEVLPIRHTVIDTICEGLAYPLGNEMITSPGTHTVALVSSRGCDSIVTLELTHVPSPEIAIDFSFENPVCAADSTGAFTINGGSGGVAPYTFSIFTDPVLLGRTTGFAAGDYMVIALDRYQCAGTEVVLLTDPEPFTIDAGPDISLLFGQSVQREVLGSYDIQDISWVLPNYLDCANCSEVEIFGVESLSYLIEATSLEGCSAFDSLTVVVDTKLRTFAPNAFSPNGDGINDFFNISTPGAAVQLIEELLVFNRWGSLVYKGSNIPINNASTGWDGIIDGKKAPIDSYLYSARLLLLDNTTEILTGSVQVVR